MIDPTMIILIMFFLLILLIVALAAIFRDKFMEWDTKLKQNIKLLFSNRKREVEQTTDQNQMIENPYMPTVSFNVERASLSGEVIEKEHFICSAQEFDTAINGIFILRALSKGELEKDLKEFQKKIKEKREYNGVG